MADGDDALAARGPRGRLRAVVAAAAVISFACSDSDSRSSGCGDYDADEPHPSGELGELGYGSFYAECLGCVGFPDCFIIGATVDVGFYAFDDEFDAAFLRSARPDLLHEGFTAVAEGRAAILALHDERIIDFKYVELAPQTGFRIMLGSTSVEDETVVLTQYESAAFTLWPLAECNDAGGDLPVTAEISSGAEGGLAVEVTADRAVAIVALEAGTFTLDVTVGAFTHSIAIQIDAAPPSDSSSSDESSSGSSESSSGSSSSGTDESSGTSESSSSESTTSGGTEP